MRVFDIEMCTEYGTSYNSYVVRGAEKVAIIDANHATFADDWLAQVAEVLGDTAPDYLVVNHTEPDHAGAVGALLKRYPAITIVCTAAAAINLKNITNLPGLAPHVVKDGEALDLGGLTLEFHLAPFLHWPDTMITWLPECKVAFTCDFLGAHFCEPRLLDARIIYHREYRVALREYYDAIMAPFAPYVRKGLDKLEALNPEIVATSHGPVLTRGAELEYALEQYRQWSAAPPEDAPQHIALFYCSSYGNTGRLAEAIAQGVQAALPAAEVTLTNLVGADLGEARAELNRADALLIGSPTINRAALPLVWELLAGIDAVNFAKRPVALFGSYGWSGEAVAQLSAHLALFRAALFEKQLRVLLVPSEDDLAKAQNFGRAFAESLQ
jgi:flavorubredoxin